MQKRDLKMDVFKGLLMIGMVWCHIIQFFVNVEQNPGMDYVMGYINAITFAGFVFTFGYTSYIAYFSKYFKDVYRKIIMASFKILGAFYISGISFRVFVEHKPISWELVKNILILKDIPGWSEFIISFALYILIAGILFYPIKRLIEMRLLFWIIVGVLLLTTFISYEKVNSIQLGLLIGTTQFACFPVVQYMPLYLLGVYFKRYEITMDKRIMIGAVILSGISLVKIALNNWQLPGRFPPTLFWVILPAFPLYLYYGVGHMVEKHKVRCNILLVLGQNTMAYLLLSNLIIFALSGVQGIKPLNSMTAFIANIVLLGLITYLLKLYRPLTKQKVEKKIKTDIREVGK
ncbi:MAG TPA: hypothetical protein GX707_07760 [Epulopiscium sp.]|nr:hypothetical protein [Candidatus Epulonipiscium sp.]